jgi:hypothetical protein
MLVAFINFKGIVMKKSLVSVLLLSVFVATPALAEKTNFSHSTFSVSAGTATPKTPSCYGGYCANTYAAFSIGGSIQFADDLLVLSLASTGLAYSSPAWNVTGGQGAFGLSVVKALGDKVDITAGVTSLSIKTDVCLSGYACQSSTDTGTGYGAGLTVGLNETKTLVGYISMTSSKYSKSTSTNTTGFGLGYYVTPNSEFSFGYASNDASSANSLAYTYHF